MSGCNDGNCGCGSSKSSGSECCGGNCGSGSSEYDTGNQMSDMMLNLADSAWNALMLEKMKHIWEKHMGKQMDKIAEASVGASSTHHMGMMKSKAEMQESLEKLNQAMLM